MPATEHIDETCQSPDAHPARPGRRRVGVLVLPCSEAVADNADGVAREFAMARSEVPQRGVETKSPRRRCCGGPARARSPPRSNRVVEGRAGCASHRDPRTVRAHRRRRHGPRLRRRRRRGLGGGVGAQPGDPLTQDPGHLHLAESDVPADLFLGEVVLESQPEDPSLARSENRDRAFHGCPLLGSGESLARASDGVAECGGLVVAIAPGGIERGSEATMAGVQRFQALPHR